MGAALHTLRELPCLAGASRCWATWRNWGVHSEAAHAEVGRLAAAAGLDHLIAVGSMAAHGRGRAAGGLRCVWDFC